MVHGEPNLFIMPQNSQSLPEYIRLPKIGQREHYTNLSRSSIDRLVRPQECNGFKPPVASRCVRIRGGSRRGTRLISLSSLLEFLGKQPKQLRNRAKAHVGDDIRAEQSTTAS
jgi:hypothetical protein